MSEIAILSPAAALATEEGWKEQVVQWRTILGQGVLPKSTDTVEKCVCIAKLGEERFGWGPMDSVTKIVIIEGNLELKATTMMELMQLRAVEEGGYVMPRVRSDERAAIAVKRKGWPEEFVFEYTRDDAVTAGLWGKVSKSGKAMPWKSYPKDMLWARCVSRVSRGAFADVTGGAYAMGEIESARQAAEALPPTETVIEQLDREYGDDDTPTGCEACGWTDGHDEGCPETPEENRDEPK